MGGIERARQQLPGSFLLAFDGNVLAGFDGLGLFLGDRQLQDAVLKFGADLFLGDAVPHIEGAAALAGVTLLTDVTAFFVGLIFIKTLGCADG